MIGPADHAEGVGEQCFATEFGPRSDSGGEPRSTRSRSSSRSTAAESMSRISIRHPGAVAKEAAGHLGQDRLGDRGYGGDTRTKPDSGAGEVLYGGDAALELIEFAQLPLRARNFPSAVSLLLRSDSNSGAPRCASNCLSIIETADGVRPSASAASARLPLRATAAKQRSISILIAKISIFLKLLLQKFEFD